MSSSAPASADSGIQDSVAARARESLGTSATAIYSAAANALKASAAGQIPRVADVGCGTGSFRGFCAPFSQNYCGIDAVRYDTFPSDADFLAADLDAAPWPIEANSFDATVAIEVIEHLENPRSFFREITRITAPGGSIIVTTPNQLSMLSKLTLLLKNEFTAFQERPGLYPAHRTALLAIDLLRIARESGLQDAEIFYSNHGRVPGTGFSWPAPLRGRSFSDNVILAARKPR